MPKNRLTANRMTTLKLPFKTIDDLEPAGKRVLVRVDINSPYDEKTGVIEESERARAHSATLRELALRKARVVVLAHQGRAGDEDFTHLDQHAKYLEKHTRIPVQFIPDITGPAALDAIRSLKPGKILLLDNVRFLAEEAIEASAEEHAKSNLVRTLSPFFDVFVNDAFSAAHRAHCSMMGFTVPLPSYAGRVMRDEYANISKATENAKHPNVYVLAGAKPDDVFKLLKAGCQSPNVDKLLTSGIIGQLSIAASGHDLGKATMACMDRDDFSKFIPLIKGLLAKYPEKIEVPLDIAVERGGKRVEVSVQRLPVSEVTKDIGSKTAKHYASIIKAAGCVYVKGPVGVYEDPNFELGTREVFNAVAKSDAFSLMGGGHTVSALKKFKLPVKSVGYISLAGGALLTYLTGEKLPALEALSAAAKRG